MDDNFEEWVESVGVASGRSSQEAGESMGVVRMYRCG